MSTMQNLEDLEKLAVLKDQGIITQEEFDAKKQSLLVSNSSSAEVADSPKSRIVFAILGFFLGFFGIHNFYLGRYIQGFFQLLPTILIGIVFATVSDHQSRMILFVILGIIFVLYILAYPLWTGLNLLLTKKDGKKRLMKENGKSLCTAFGIITLCLYLLLLLGPCTIGGLAGYTMAMNRHNVNTALDYALRALVTAQTDMSQTIDYSNKVECSTVLNFEQQPKTLEECFVMKKNDQVFVEITFESQSAADLFGDRTSAPGYGKTFHMSDWDNSWKRGSM